jgi:hypothetical protein
MSQPDRAGCVDDHTTYAPMDIADVAAPTPRPHAERAPEGEVTAAVMRTARALHDVAAKEGLVSPGGFGIDWDTSDAFVADARKALDAALDVEEMVGVLASHAAWRSHGPYGYGLECSCGTDLGEHSMAVNANDVHQRHQAEALRAAILGGAA